MRKILIKLNPIEHMINENHSLSHRVIIGIVISASGFAFAEIWVEGAMHTISAFIGFGMHGVGFTPIIDYLIKKYNK